MLTYVFSVKKDEFPWRIRIKMLAGKAHFGPVNVVHSQ